MVTARPFRNNSGGGSWAVDPEGITGEELLTFVNTELFPKLKELSVAAEKADRRRVVRDVFEDAYNYMKSGQLIPTALAKQSSLCMLAMIRKVLSISCHELPCSTARLTILSAHGSQPPTMTIAMGIKS
jgi:hypothetical protein